jgi:pathogenesis-related protein 1
MVSMMSKRGVSLSLLSLVLLACANGSANSEPAPAPAPAEDARPSPAEAETAPVQQPDAPAIDPVAQGFLDAHNHHRATVSPAPSEPLPAMRWSDELATYAKRVADRCSFEHSKTDYGENLSARTGPVDPAQVVAEWAAEAEHYDAKRNRCAAGEVCGHYTQVVWRASTQLGCANSRCTKNSPFGDGEWTMTVCNYAPAGNYSGERPY